MASNCSWHLTLDGKENLYSSEYGLDAELFDILSKAAEGGVDLTKYDFVLASLSPQEITAKKIEDIKKECKEASRLVTTQIGTDPEDIESYYYIPGSIGVTRFLQEFGVEGEDSSIVIPFNETKWKENKIEDYIKEGKTQEEAEELVKKEMSSWPKMSEMGTEVHSLFEWVFNGEDGEQPKTEYLSKTNGLVESTLKQIRDFKKFLQDKYDGCNFYTELALKSDDLDPGMKALMQRKGYDSINGKIDLLVVDKFGKGHLFDFKVSRKKVNGAIWDQITRMSNETQRTFEAEQDRKYGKNMSEHWWHSTKKEAASYQLSMYAAMLKQKGVTVVDANIVPVHTTLDYADPDTQLEVTGINGVDVQFGKDDDGNDRMITRVAEVLGNGKYATTVAQVIHNPFTLSGDSAVTIQKIFNCFFPKNATIANREFNRANIDHYKDNPKVVQKLKPSDKRYDDGMRYRIVKTALKGQVEYAKDEQELDEKLQAYVEQLANAKSNNNIELAEMIGSTMDDGNVDDFASHWDIGSRSFLRSQFKRYFTNGWNFERNDSLNSLGIFIFSKGNKVEIVSITDQSLKNRINLGTKKDPRYTILGKTKKDSKVNNKEILSSTGGHMELMKAMTYIAMNQDKFVNKQIVEVRVVNAIDGEEDTVANSKLINNYNALVQENLDSGAVSLKEDLFMQDVEAYIEGAKDRMFATGRDFDGFFDANETAYTSEWIRSAIEKMRTDNEFGDTLYSDSRYDSDDPIWHAYTYLNKAYLASYGLYTVSEKDPAKFIDLNGGLNLNGLRVASMQYSPSSNIRTLGDLINRFANAVRKKAYDTGFPMVKCFEEIYDKYGTGSGIFKSWLETDADGNIRPDLHLKDPNDPEIAADPVMKKGLDTFLKTMAKLRWGDDISDADVEYYKATGEYYELPLTEAVASRQIKNLGVTKAIKNKIAEFSELTEGIFAGTDIDVEKESKKSGSLYNKFALSGPARDSFIKDHEVGFFETDMELVFNQALVAFTKSNVSKEYLPLIAAMRLSLLHTDQYGGNKKNDSNKNLSEIIKTFDDLVKSKVYGMSILNDTEQRLMKVLKVLKAGFTTMTLSLNVRSFLRESLQGIWTGLSRAGIKVFPGIDEKHYIAGLTHVMQECHKNISGVSKLQQLNQIYAMANQSLSQVAQNRRLNWLNIKHWGHDTLFLTATAPDFMHRVSILVAKMMSDGCWDAYELNEDGRLIYNFDKDERFKVYRSNDTSNPEYLKQRSLYLTMLDAFNEEGFRKEDGSLLKEGDALPQAYTSKESQSIKNYADILYGHYDDESRSLICDGLFGSLFLQYKTYLTAKLEQWTLPGGIYSTETIKQQKDPFGNDLYELIRYDEYDDNGEPMGMPHRDILSKEEYEALDPKDKANARLYFDYEGIPMEGMLQEQLYMLKSLATMNVGEFVKTMKEDPIKRGYWLLGMHDMWVMMLMEFLVTFVFGSIFEVEHKDGKRYKAEVRQAMRKVDPGSQLLYNVLIGSFADSQFPNVIGSFTDKPPVLMAAQRFGRSSWNLITDDHNLGYFLTQNFGALRDFQGIAKRALEEE